MSSINLAIPSNTYSGFPGYKIFNDTALATYHASGGVPSNKAALDTLASSVASDFYNWHSLGFDTVFNGVISPRPNGVLTEIEWLYNDEDATTRLFCNPSVDDFEELAHVHGPSASACIDVASSFTTASKVPSWEIYGPPAVPIALGNNIVIPRFQVSLEDGRLRSQFTQSDIVNCGCGGGSSNCTGQICVKLFDSCTNRGIPNATSYVSHSGGGASGFCVTATGTTAGGTAFGYCCVPVSDTGTSFNYNVNIVGPSPYSPVLVTGVHVNCNDVTTITRGTGGGTICVRITDGCLFNVPDLNTTVTLGGVATPGVYGSDGLYCFGPGLAPGTYTLSATTPGDCYVSPATFSVPFGGGCLSIFRVIGLKDPPCCCALCGTSAVVIDNPSGVTFTSSHMGTVFLPVLSNSCFFQGVINYNYPGNPGRGCAAAIVPVTVRVQLDSTISGGQITYTFPFVAGFNCPVSGGFTHSESTAGPYSSCSPSPFMFSGSVNFLDGIGSDFLFDGSPDVVTVTV